MITVTVRDNEGEDSTLSASTMNEAEAEAKAARSLKAYMVCIEVDGSRVSRWDRSVIQGSNAWKKAGDVNEFETLGPRRIIIQSR